jgi:hypothetical protein
MANNPSQHVGRRHVIYLLGIMLAASFLEFSQASDLWSPEAYRNSLDARQIQRDEIIFRSAYEALRTELRDGLATFRATTARVGYFVNPYSTPLDPDPGPVWLSGAAATSRAALGLVSAGLPTLQWLIRNTGFCYAALQDKEFDSLSVIELKWTSDLLRLDVAAAAALDSSIVAIANRYAFIDVLGGDTRPFTAFARAVANSRGPSKLLSMTAKQYERSVSRFLRYGEERRLANAPNSLLIGDIMGNLKGDALSLPFLNARISRKWLAIAFVPIGAFLNYIALHLWMERQRRAIVRRRLSLAWLIGLRGSHAWLDIMFLILSAALIISAYIWTILLILLFGSRLLACVAGLGAATILATWIDVAVGVRAAD